MSHYLKLYRLDVAMISFFSYMIGASLASRWNFQDIIIAAALSLISTNFIYSFNSWADREIDRLNKPCRPIPCGKIKPENALIYSVILLGLSLIYPFFVFKSYLTLVLFLILPVLGLLYSAKPFRLRRYSLAAIFTVSTGLITPISLGYFMHTSDTGLFPLFIVLFIYCLGVVPLKDIEDADGDVKSGIQNLFAGIGKKLLVFSICILFLDFVLIVLFAIPHILKLYLLIFIITSIGVICIFGTLRKDLNNLYRALIRLVIVECIIIYVLSFLLKID